MKKFLVLVLTVAVLASSFVLPSMAATEPANIGGFDFHSITFHYSEPVVIGYVMKERNVLDENGEVVLDKRGNPKTETYYAFGEPVDSYTIYATENKANQVLSSLEESLYTSYGKNEANFYSVNSTELGIGETSLAYTKYPAPAAYITQIQDKTAIELIGNNNVCGLGDFYDQAKTPNPNMVVENGFFVDEATGKKLDDNGYILDNNNFWHDTKGARVEAFIEDPNGALVWVPLSARMEKGKVLANSEVTAAYLMEKGVISYPEFGKTDEKKETEYKAKKDLYATTFVQLYLIKTDTNNDGKLSKEEIAAVDKADKVFTEADISVYTSPMGVKTLERGTPASGVPKMKATITSVSVEIDALGTQLYSDVAADPQQKNTIVLSVGSVEDNIIIANEIVAKNPKKINNIGTIVGTAKSVTTKTSMALESNAELTKKSVTFDATAETLAAIKNGTPLYLNFHVATQQPVEGIDVSETYFDFAEDDGEYYVNKAETNKEDAEDGKIVSKAEFDKLKGKAKKQYELVELSEIGPITVFEVIEADLANAPVKAANSAFISFNLFGMQIELSKTVFFIIVGAAAAVLVAIIVVIVIVISKKKKKKAASKVEDADTPADAEKAEEADVPATEEVVSDTDAPAEDVAEENKED